MFNTLIIFKIKDDHPIILNSFSYSAVELEFHSVLDRVCYSN